MVHTVMFLKDSAAMHAGMTVPQSLSFVEIRCRSKVHGVPGD